MTLCRLMIAIERHRTANVVVDDLDLNFQGQTFQVNNLRNKCWKIQALIAIVVIYEVKYLPSIGATANVVRRDLDLHFKVANFEM